jgi:LssY C-terminus
MRTAWKLASLVFLFCIAATGMRTIGRARPFEVKAASDNRPVSIHQEQQSQAPKAEGVPDSLEDSADEELAPAALQLDVSGFSPLIRELYQATRETKEQPTLAHLAQAKKLLEDNADVKVADAQGRTALHWAVFGSSYSTKQSIVVAYEEIADSLIQHGVEINREDVYQDTALDYLLYAPTFEMQTLLIEHGASSGFLAAFYHFFSDRAEGVPPTHTAAVSLSRKADLAPGQTLSIRLDIPVYSDRSRTGDPLTATVTYPLCKDGEQVACKDGELLIPPGTRVNGTILFAQKAPDKYSRPRLVLDFSNIVHKSGTRSPLYARVLDVDNARETVRNNEILGIIQPHASKKASVAMAALSAANPIAGYTVKGVQTIYGLSIRREILFPTGTDIQIQIVRPSMLKEKEVWPGWQKLPVDARLRQLVVTAPMRTSTPNKIPSDPTNLMFLGPRKQLIAAFGEAGWIEADDLGVKSALKVAQATVRQSGYSSAPVSTLLIDGRAPDLVFQKSLDTFAKRHHLRVWKLAKTYNGQDVWVGAATHDIATTNANAGTKWSHRIDPHVDRERDWVETDLLFVGTGVAYADVERPGAPKKVANATGDEIVTDGKMSVIQVATSHVADDQNQVPTPATRP